MFAVESKYIESDSAPKDAQPGGGGGGGGGGGKREGHGLSGVFGGRVVGNGDNTVQPPA